MIRENTKSVGKDVYKFKLKKRQWPFICMYLFSCFGRTPTLSKQQKKMNTLIEKGRERLDSFINADHIWEVILEHHKVLKQINTTKSPLRENIYNYIINIDTSSEEEPPLEHN